MPRPREDFGPDCGPGRNDKEVHCRPCTIAADGHTVYMLRTSWKTHVQAPCHVQSVTIVPEKLQFRREVAENYARPYEAEPIVVEHNIAEVEPAPIRASMRWFDLASESAPPEMSSEERSLLFSEIALAETASELEARLEHEFEQRRLEALAQDYGLHDVGGFVESFVTAENSEELMEPDLDDVAVDGHTPPLAPKRDTTGRYYPYPNETECLIDVLDNLPNLRLSSSQLRMVLWAMKRCNPADVPNYDAFRATQTRLRETIGVGTIRCVSELGNIFYINDVRDIISRDFENPETAEHLRFYPEETDGEMSEVWHGQRWREYPLDMLTPSYHKMTS